MTETTTAIPFRSPAPVAEGSSPSATGQAADPSATTQTPTKGFSDDASPSVFQELEKKPFTVKFMDLDLYYDDESFTEVREQAAELDEFIKGVIKQRGMNDSAGSYQEVVEALYKQIGKSKNEDKTQSLKRLSTAATAIRRLESAKLPPVLNAKNLTPKEFEGILQ